VERPNPQYAVLLQEQLGGGNGELKAAMQYMSQSFRIKDPEIKDLFLDIAAEELGHMEMMSAIIYQLTRNISVDNIKGTPFEPFYVDHTTGVYPIAASGVPFDMKYVGVKGDPLADLAESQAAEQKARVTYDNLIRLSDDPDVTDPLRFLREREIVHFQRFGDAMRVVQDKLDGKNFYAFNPAFDKRTK
jgi:spore coat protein JC